MSNYPPGAEDDHRAPFNRDEEEEDYNEVCDELTRACAMIREQRKRIKALEEEQEHHNIDLNGMLEVKDNIIKELEEELIAVSDNVGAYNQALSDCYDSLAHGHAITDELHDRIQELIKWNQ